MKTSISLLTILLALLPAVAGAKTISWHGNGAIVCTMQKKTSRVVDKAFAMFAQDMEAKTGQSVKRAGSGNVLVYQLDMATNKDMKALGTMRVPVPDFITKADAFWTGVRDGKMVVVGSNGRGAAYGLLSLENIGDDVDDRFEATQIPSVEFRAIAMEDFGDIDYSQLFEIMLRLRANTLCEGWDEGNAPAHFAHAVRLAAEEYGIVVATPHGNHSLRLQDHKKSQTVGLGWIDDNYGYMEHVGDGDDNGALYHLSYSGRPHDYLWLCTTQPGLVANEMSTAFYNGATKLWAVAIHDPVVAAYQLNLFMDMAWDIKSVSPSSTKQHLQSWLTRQFGTEAAAKLIDPLSQYYRLVAVRRPEFMDFSRQQAPSKSNRNGDGGVSDTEFNAEEFGNELERYINDYRAVCEKVKSVEQLISDGRKDDYFTMVEYPVCCSALMAEKMLQAQESRLIGRPASFHHDSEALESAARSIKAYQKIWQLTGRYNEIAARGKWNRPMNDAPHHLAVFGQPVLTDTLSADEVRRYGNAEPVEAAFTDDNTIVRNASEYAVASSGVRRVELLGRSLAAMDLYSGDTIVYKFRSGVVGGVLRLAFVPTHALDGGSLQCSVSVDGKTPTTVIVTDGSRSERWADGVLRGQAIVTLPVALLPGVHTLTIKALSDHVVLDQWMIDRDTDRHFYVFPRETTN